MIFAGETELDVCKGCTQTMRTGGGTPTLYANYAHLHSLPLQPHSFFLSLFPHPLRDPNEVIRLTLRNIFQWIEACLSGVVGSRRVPRASQRRKAALGSPNSFSLSALAGS